MGSAVYPGLALLNHSCEPNTVKYWEGGRMVLLACQPVRPGEELTENYGPHFASQARAARRAWLSDHYW